MKNIIGIIIFSLSALAHTSCMTDGGHEQPATGDEVLFRIVPTVVQTASGNIDGEVTTGGQGATRAKVDGAFPVGAMMGLGISAPFASPAIADFYDNFYALNSVSGWNYYLNGINGGNQLSGFSRWNAIEVYGYYPYNAAVTDLSAVPFSIATPGGGGVANGTETTACLDYMVAGTAQKDMSVPFPVGNLSLNFGHLMTALELRIYRTSDYILPALKVGSATFEITGGGRAFTTGGTFDATNPDMVNLPANITATQTATKMTIAYPSATAITYWTSSVANPTPPARLLIIMPELRVAGALGDAHVKISFTFFDTDGTRYQFGNLTAGVDPSIEFDLSTIDNGVGMDTGLLAGYTYAITASVGTYTHFSTPVGSPTPPHVNNPALTDVEVDDEIDL